MKYLLQLTIVFATCLLSAGCAKNFDKVNNDPIRPKSITPGVMLGQMQYRFVNSGIQSARNFTHELMQVDAPRSSSSGNGVHRYFINPGAGVWSGFYTLLTDVQDIYATSSKLKENNYKAIALIYKTWAYSIMTDLYGDIPFSLATQATEDIFQVPFDKQKDIYIQLLRNLDTANAILDDTKALTYGGDLVYNANTLTGGKNVGIQKWKKFANSLKLRLLLRILKRDGEINVTEQINTILADPAKYPVFAANSDEAIFHYPGTYPYFNPYYNARTLDWRDGTYYTKFFVNKLNTDNDPRRALWMTTVTVSGSSVYQGIESGYPITTEYAVGKNSSYPDALKTLPQLGVMMTYAEVEFMKAELALKGFTTGKIPKQHYEAGITASMAQWGATMPTGFLQQTGVVYDETATAEKQLEQIMMQKYIAYFFVDYQSWFEKRRTGYPVLPRGSGIPVENVFPSRIPYPTYLQSMNAGNLKNAITAMGGDLPTTKVWWDK